MHKKIAILVIIVALSLLAFITAKSITGKEPKTITYKIADPIGDWGYPTPYGMYPRGPGYVRMSLVFDTLIWKDREGIVPALAKSWSYISNENAYIFDLRDDVTWHDGKNFTAKDVVFTFNYIKKHLWVWADSSVVKEAKETAENQVKVYLNEPYAPFLTNVAGALPMIPKHIWENIEKPEQFMDKQAVIGTGPYQLVDYSKVQGTYLFEAYENYYQGKPVADRIMFVKVNSEIAPVALKRHEVNASSIPAEVLDDLKSKGLKIEEEPPAWAAKLIVNHKKEPLSSKKLRHALAYAIDRQKIIQIAQRGYAITGSIGLIPPSNKAWHNPNVAQYNYDMTKAKNMIERLGYKPDSDGYYQKDGKKLEFELLVGSASQVDFARIGELIKSDLEKVGIAINLRGLESKAIDARIKNWNFDLAIGGHGGLGGDPEMLNRVIIGEGFNSARYFQNKELVNLSKRQIHQMDIGKRKQAVDKIQEIYAQELPDITLYHPKWYWAHDGSIDLYYTEGGLAIGIPIPLNKLSFLKHDRIK